MFTASITAIFFSEGREEYLHLSALKTYFHFKYMFVILYM